MIHRDWTPLRYNLLLYKDVVGGTTLRNCIVTLVGVEKGKARKEQRSRV